MGSGVKFDPLTGERIPETADKKVEFDPATGERITASDEPTPKASPKPTTDPIAEALAAKEAKAVKYARNLPYGSLAFQDKPVPQPMEPQKPIPDFAAERAKAIQLPSTPPVRSDATQVPAAPIKKPRVTEADLTEELKRRDAKIIKIGTDKAAEIKKAGFDNTYEGTKKYLEAIGEPIKNNSTLDEYQAEVDAADPALAAEAARKATKEYNDERARRTTLLATAMRTHAKDAVKAGFPADPSGVEQYMKSIKKPLPEQIHTPEQFAEERTGVKRATSAIGKALVGLGDAWSELSDASGWTVVAKTLTGGAGQQREGQRVLQAEGALQDKAALDAIKAKKAAGEILSLPEQRKLELSGFFSSLGQAVDAVKEHPGQSAQMMLVDFVENAPLYALTDMAAVGGIKALTSVVKDANAAARLGQAIKKGQAAASAELRAQRTAQLGAKLVAPDMLKSIGIEVAHDMPANVAAGMVMNKAKGQEYKASDFIADLVSGGIIDIPMGVMHSLKGGHVLTAAEFRKVANAFGDIGMLANEPAVADIVTRLKTLPADQVLMDEGLKVSTPGRSKTVSADEARAAGYGEDVAAGPEAGREVLGSTKGTEIKLRPGSDLATLEEEISTARHNVLRKRAEAAPAGPEAGLLGRINEWANSVHAENNARPEAARVALPQNTEAGNVELFTKAMAQEETGVDLVGPVDVPDDIYNDWGKTFNTRVRTGDARVVPEGALRGEARVVAPAIAEEPVAAPVTQAAEADPVEHAAADLPAAVKPSVTEFSPATSGEAGATLRRPLESEAPGFTPDMAEAAAGVAGRAEEARIASEKFKGEVNTAVGRAKRREITAYEQYQLKGHRADEAGADPAEAMKARKEWKEKRTKSPYFKKWFGDSKVVDESGKPLVVYHGTGQAGLDEIHGGWFATDKAVTKEFGNNRYDVYLNIKNPIEDEPFSDVSPMLEEYRKFSNDPELTRADAEENGDLKDMAANGPFRDYLEKQGYDGIHAFDESNAVTSDVWVPFSPTQIKSAIGNRGTFDAADPRIQYQLRARRTPGPISDQSRLSAIDVTKAVLSSPKPLSALKAAEKLGLKGRVAEDAVKRASTMVRALKAGKPFDEVLASDALKDVMRKPSETIKKVISNATHKGITGTETITARAALQSVIRQMQLKADLAAAKDSAREARRIKRLIVTAARSNLDPELRGQMLAAVRDATTAADLRTAMEKIDLILAREQLNNTLDGVRDLLKTNSDKMLPEFRDEFNDMTKGLTDKNPTAVITKFKEWFERQTDKDVIDAVPPKLIKALENFDAEKIPGRAEIRKMGADEIAAMQEKWQMVNDAIGAIVAAEAEKKLLIGRNDALKLDLTVKQSMREIEKANPEELVKKDGIYQQPTWWKRYLRYGSSPEVLAILAGGRDGWLHNILFKRVASASSSAYFAREQLRSMMMDVFKQQGMDERKLVHWRNEKFDVKLENGETLTLTRPEAVSLYATMANRESRDLVKKNGIQLYGNRGTGERATLTDSDIKAIIAKMTDFDIKTAESMLAIFQSAQPALNETSVLLHGYEKFTTDNYFPRFSSRDAVDRNMTELSQVWKAKMLEDGGFTKEREKHQNPLIIMDAMNVFDRHIGDVASFSELAVPLRNAARLIGNHEISQEIGKRLGGSLDKDINAYLLDASGMNNRAMMDDASKLYRRWLRAFSVGTLGYRPTTILNNLFGASVQIYAELPDKFRGDFWKNWTTMSPAEESRLFDEMKVLDGYFDHRYSRDPYRTATWGNMEMPETIGASEAWLTFKKVQDHSMKWQQDAERRSAVATYKAIRDNTSKEEALAGLSKMYRDVDIASDPIGEFAAHETMVLTRRTQNPIDALDKSAFARKMSENPVAGSLFLFTSQLYKLRDMGFLATLDYQRGHITKAEYARKLALILTSAAIIPTTASYAWRQAREGFKEQKDSDTEKRMGLTMQMLLNAVETIDPIVGGIVRTISQAAGGSPGAGKSATPFNEVVAGVAHGIERSINGRDDKKIPALIDALSGAGQMTGVPIAAPAQAVEGIVKFIQDGDPLVPFQNSRFEIKKKLGMNDDGTARTIEQAIRAGVKLTGAEIAQYKQADDVIRRVNAIKKNEAIPEEKAKEIINKMTEKKPK